MSNDENVASNTTNSSNNKLHVAVGATVAVMGSILTLTAPFVVLKTPLPYMATPAYKIQRALQFLSTSTKRGGTFVDLGSGDGEAVYQAYRAGMFDKVIGYELNWTLWGLSQMRRIFFWGPQARRSTHIYCRDLFASPLPKETTAVMVFGVTPLMKSLSFKLARETRPGVHILSYRFPLPIQNVDNPKATKDLLSARLVYDYEEMRVYEVVDKDEQPPNGRDGGRSEMDK